MAFTEKYVTASASGGGDGSIGNPWTIEEAALNATSGQRVNVKAGSYTLAGANIFMQGSNEANPFSIRGYKTTIGDLDGVPSSQLVDGTDLPLLTTSNSSYYMYFNGSYQIIENISFKTSTSVPAAYVDSSKSFVRRCRFESQTTGQYAIRRNGDCVFFSSCYFKMPSGATVETIDAAGSSFFTGCVFDTGKTAIDTTDSAHFIDCILKDLSNNAIAISTTGHSMISNCTFYNISGNGVNISSTNSGPVFVRSCIFHSIGAYAISTSSGDFDCFATNNLYYGVTLGQFNNIYDDEHRNIYTDSSDPFTTASGGDFTLLQSSNGVKKSSPKLFEVFDQGTSRDIGAVQSSGGGGPRKVSLNGGING